MMKYISLVLTAGMSASVALAADIVVEMKRIDTTGVGAPLGKITITSSSDGVRLAPDLNGLPPGSHGFHLHENGSCLPGEKDGSVADLTQPRARCQQVRVGVVGRHESVCQCLALGAGPRQARRGSQQPRREAANDPRNTALRTHQ